MLYILSSKALNFLVYHFFSIGIIPYKSIQPLQHMTLQGKQDNFGKKLTKMSLKMPINSNFRP